MMDEEILIKAVKKAVANGLNSKNAGLDLADASTNDIIFNHEFAKAFWGEKKLDTLGWYPWMYPTIESWRYELSQMAMVKEPLKYLEQYL